MLVVRQVVLDDEGEVARGGAGNLHDSVSVAREGVFEEVADRASIAELVVANPV